MTSSDIIAKIQIYIQSSIRLSKSFVNHLINLASTVYAVPIGDVVAKIAHPDWLSQTRDQSYRLVWFEPDEHLSYRMIGLNEFLSSGNGIISC